MINDNVRQVLSRIPSAWGNGDTTGHVLFVDWLIEEMQPKVTVDLGIDYGYSLIAFAHNNPGKVYGIDGFEGDEWTGTRNTYDQVSGLVTNLQLNNVTLIKGFFDDVVKTWDTKIDLLHIDGFHSYEAVKNDFEKWSGFVNSTGVILFHDTDSHDARFGVKQFFQELDMPKHELFGFQGLGIVSNNKKLMKKIKEYTP
jgi:hypothetical protein